MTTLLERKPTKKELKKLINDNGFFTQMTVQADVNSPDMYRNRIPEGATYFEGIASNGELNRNGYIIRESAWRSAIQTYFLNPVILLQHDVEQPIGMALDAKITENGLWVAGYIFDDLTGGKFGRGLLKALSTGHYTKEVEFENTKTGTVLSEEDFTKLDIREQMSDDYVMAVTKLDWVEFSLVTIGSNKKSQITLKNAKMERLNIKEEYLEQLDAEVVERPEVEGEEEVSKDVEAETPQVEAEAEEDTETSTAEQEPESQDSEKEGEEPDEVAEDVESDETSAEAEEPTEEEGEKEEAEQNKIKVSKDQYEKLSVASQMLLKTINAVEISEEKSEEVEEDKKEENAIELSVEERLEKLCADDSELKAHLVNLVEVSLTLKEELAAVKEENASLKETLKKIPESKRMILSGNNSTLAQEVKAKPGQAISELFAKAGVKL